MKRSASQLAFTIIFLFWLFPSPGSCQYSETFSNLNKGVTDGPCGSTAESCAGNDFTGVDWSVNGDFSGLGAGDGAYTNGSALIFDDTDAEICWESPVLDITGAASNFSFSVDVVWESHDMEDYIDVEYQIDGGAWIQIPTVTGTGPHTVDFNTASNTGFMTIGETGLSGSATLSVRVCVYVNLFEPFEYATIDNVSVPEAGVTVLPVEFLFFNSEKTEDEVLLHWATASETNNEKFEIEHSTDGKQFETIGEVQGKGNTVTISNYSFKHKRPSVGINYFKLKQIDFDGHFEYSKILSVNMEAGKPYIGTFYPNPSNTGKVQLDYTAIKKSILEFSTYNLLSGNLISSQKIPVIKGKNKLNFDLANLSNGVYLIEVKNEAASVWRKLVIN